MRRWTLIVLILLFVALAATATAQLLLGQKETRCPGPNAPFGGPNDLVRCEQRSPSP
jgi:hypothetical protein